MNDGGNGGIDESDADGSPVDFDRLEVIETRLGGDERFVRVLKRPAVAPDQLVYEYELTFYPRTVESARLEIVWYENGDFSIHYHEAHRDGGTFDHRWDRHPSAHNSRDHVHPGPEALTPGVDASHPRDWRDVLSNVLMEVEGRQRAFWSA